MPNGWIRGKLDAIEGIGPQYARRLKKAGVGSLHSLLKQGMHPQGRREIAQSTGLSESTILEWVNRADLFRVKGVGEEYSDLLEQAGVDTVVELAQRNPKNLYQTLVDVNQTKNLVRRMPTEGQVKGWVRYAKSLKRVVKY